MKVLPDCWAMTLTICALTNWKVIRWSPTLAIELSNVALLALGRI